MTRTPLAGDSFVALISSAAAHAVRPGDELTASPRTVRREIEGRIGANVHNA